MGLYGLIYWWKSKRRSKRIFIRYKEIYFPTYYILTNNVSTFILRNSFWRVALICLCYIIRVINQVAIIKSIDNSSRQLCNLFDRLNVRLKELCLFKWSFISSTFCHFFLSIRKIPTALVTVIWFRGNMIPTFAWTLILSDLNDDPVPRAWTT